MENVDLRCSSLCVEQRRQVCYPAPMQLTVGERLSGSGPATQPGGYIVTDLVRETLWFNLYAGKKIFYNFDSTSKRPRKTDDKEWLDVCLRPIHYPHRDDGAAVGRRRALARAEARRVLA